MQPTPSRPRLMFLDALRAFAALVILWHHFASYPPLSVQAAPLCGGLMGWLHDHGRVTQVFFVVGGYVMAMGMEGKVWNLRGFCRFAAHRYVRLGIPYLAAAALAVVACALGRGVLPASVTGGVPGLREVLAHVFFLQDLLGVESFSAGLWFVCINFQLGLVYSALLVFRDAAGSRCWPCDRIAGWALAAASLFWFNGHAEWDSTALYFYPHFFMGVLAWRCTRTSADRWLFAVYQAVFALALVHDWRGRLVGAMVIGCLLVAAERFGWMSRWPKNRWITGLGGMSYSLFLVHFPVLVVVSTVWGRVGWSGAWQAACGLAVAFFASLAVAALVYRFVERPAARLAGRWKLASGKSAGNIRALPDSQSQPVNPP